MTLPSLPWLPACLQLSTNFFAVSGWAGEAGWTVHLPKASLRRTDLLHARQRTCTDQSNMLPSERRLHTLLHCWAFLCGYLPMAVSTHMCACLPCQGLPWKRRLNSPVSLHFLYFGGRAGVGSGRTGRRGRLGEAGAGNQRQTLKRPQEHCRDWALWRLTSHACLSPSSSSLPPSYLIHLPTFLHEKKGFHLFNPNISREAHGSRQKEKPAFGRALWKQAFPTYHHSCAFC